jgi:hypothetical protein
MKICPSCGCLNFDTVGQCQKCGTRLPAMKASPVVAVGLRHWNFRMLGVALVISFILQMILFDWLHSEGGTEAEFGLAWDAFVVARMVLAYFRKETGRDWLIYAVICYMSPIWIIAIVHLSVGKGAP